MKSVGRTVILHESPEMRVGTHKVSVVGGQGMEVELVLREVAAAE